MTVKEKVTVCLDIKVSIRLNNYEHNPLCDLSEDQIDEIVTLVSDALPQSAEVYHNGKLKKLFLEIDDIEDIVFWD